MDVGGVVMSKKESVGDLLSRNIKARQSLGR